MGKHDKTEMIVADIPADDYYRAQINTLEKKLDDLQTQYEMAQEYISQLTDSNKALNIKVDHLRNALLGVIEERYGDV